MAMQRYIVIDDCICTGDTLQNIFDSIDEEGSRHRSDGREGRNIDKAVCAGIILYNTTDGRAFFTNSKRGQIPLFSFSVSGRYDV